MKWGNNESIVFSSYPPFFTFRYRRSDIADMQRIANPNRTRAVQVVKLRGFNSLLPGQSLVLNTCGAYAV